MSVRRELYELLTRIPGGNAVTRIVATGEFLDALPPAERERAERRVLALAKAMADGVDMDPNLTLDEFFERVDAIERSLVN
ncbi:MAG: hypothetical protein JHD15_07000 [Phenylobacterium sp.]|uniref:hypothetical protein n=1 Tax=Phenylobacterium sp. TaxID=1871053 RepID=UPI001A23FF85|nr:hypothetical protein [Phenylobacterium sp.]MBJ7410100.1 hypothetical protein [Phenylobacterium sp.]